MDFNLKITAIGAIPVLELSGPLMDTEVYRFSRELKQLARKGCTTIAIDVSKCEFMDSHALGLLVFHHNELQKNQGRLIMINENTDEMAYMTGLLESTGLNQLFSIIESRRQLAAGEVAPRPKRQ